MSSLSAITFYSLLLCGFCGILFTPITAQETPPPAATFKPITPEEIKDNPVKLIAQDWLLLTAGKQDKFNMMTVSWATIGNLWGAPVVFIFVRPQRYTFEFVEKEKYFTLTAFAEQYRAILNYCGSKSGRNVDKVKETGLMPRFTPLGNVYYEQARLVIECEKIYADFIKPELFIDPQIPNAHYPQKDFHKMYVGKIVNVLAKE